MLTKMHLVSFVIKTIVKYLMYTFKGPRSAIGKEVYQEIVNIFGPHIIVLSVVYSQFESNLNHDFTTHLVV